MGEHGQQAALEGFLEEVAFEPSVDTRPHSWPEGKVLLGEQAR